MFDADEIEISFADQASERELDKRLQEKDDMKASEMVEDLGSRMASE